jgi:hypothetical protein
VIGGLCETERLLAVAARLDELPELCEGPSQCAV